MRPVLETGAQYLPECRDQMVRGPKRQATGDVHRSMSLDELKALRSVETETVIPAADDRLAALVTRVPPLQSCLDKKVAHNRSGHYYLIN